MRAHRITLALALAIGLAFTSATGILGLAVPTSEARQSCDPSFPTVCVPPVYEWPDGDICQVIGGPVVVYGPDPRFPDHDGDGIICEPEDQPYDGGWG